jgi:hypothetical protein
LASAGLALFQSCNWQAHVEVACNHMISPPDSHPMDNIDGFDPMTMSYLGNPIPVGLLPHTEYLHTNSGMDMQDHLSTFDTETYMRLEDQSYSGQPNAILTIF